MRKFRLPQFAQRAPVVTAVAVAVVLGVTGWALADGDVPLLSSSSSDPTTTTTTTTTSGGSTGANTDNVASAVNTKDGKSVFALSLKIVQAQASDGDAVNAAVALASCEDCQTVAIALEAVLVAGDATSFDPYNVALAINSGCSSCQTLAAAYQTVVQHDGRVRISGAGRREIADIRTDLLALRNSGLDVLAIQRQADAAADRLVRVLRTQVFPIGRPPEAGDAARTAASASTTAAPASTTTTTAAPQDTTTTVQSTTTTTTIP